MRSLLLTTLLVSATAMADPVPPTSSPAPAAPSAPAPAPAPAPTPGAPVVKAAPVLSPIVLEELPPACRDLGKLAGSPSPAAALSARISLASCVVDQKLKTLVLCDCEQSVQDVEAAAAPGIVLLDEVYAAGDSATKILARQALGDLLQGLATRLLATVPPAMDSSEAAIALHETRVQLLQPLVSPLGVRARAAYSDVDRLARENPQLAKNAAVLAAVRSTRAKLAQDPNAASQTATR